MKKIDKSIGFLAIDRELPEKRNVEERVEDYKEIYQDFPEEKIVAQSNRCMGCGVPFCHQGCPLGNLIPDFNDAVFEEDWERAAHILHSTNNFPEFTGRICPAPCEASCVLSINKPAVTIEQIEKSIAEKAFDLGIVKPPLPLKETGKLVAIIGSGPAGLAAAEQLRKAGHAVHVYEKDHKPGGLLRYGIPDFKLEKWVIDRRMELMKEAGINFHLGVEIGKNITLKSLKEDFDAILLAVGSSKPRKLTIPATDGQGVHFAMDYLTAQNKRAEGIDVPKEELWAEGKHVIVIGGGDTGSDCVGTANRQKAASVTQLQYRPMPQTERDPQNPWPEWPMTFTSSTSHEEGCERKWGWLTKEFVRNENGKVTGLKISELAWEGSGKYREVENSEVILPCDLALIAIGYEGPDNAELNKGYLFQTDEKGHYRMNDWQSSVDGVFVAGDAYRGQSLVVWAIADGREAARAIDTYLMGDSDLEGISSSEWYLEV
jgi:glutamate synthase (NADPH) small chain